MLKSQVAVEVSQVLISKVPQLEITKKGEEFLPLAPNLSSSSSSYPRSPKQLGLTPWNVLSPSAS